MKVTGEPKEFKKRPVQDQDLEESTSVSLENYNKAGDLTCSHDQMSVFFPGEKDCML